MILFLLLLQSNLLFALVLLLFCKNGQCNYGHSVVIINKLARLQQDLRSILFPSFFFFFAKLKTNMWCLCLTTYQNKKRAPLTRCFRMLLSYQSAAAKPPSFLV